MASTNKTTNLLLSQFLGTDHFSFLTDYNGDMLKIDTYCGNLKALIDGESSKTDKNTESIQNIQSDIESIQSVQERQNTNITNNTTDITLIKKNTAENTAKIDQNTADIKLLKQGSGSIIDIDVTKLSNNGMQTFMPRLKFNTQKNEFILNGNASSSPTSVLNGISYVGKIDASSLPQKVKSIITRTSINSVIGFVKYLFTQTIDGTSYSIPISMPLFCDIYSDDGTLNEVNMSISPKSNLPNIDGDVISSASYIINGVISLSDKLV